MQRFLLRVEKCRACNARPASRHNLCVHCISIFFSLEMKRFERYIKKWYGW